MRSARWIPFYREVVLSNLGLLRKPFRLFLVVTKRCASQCKNCKIWLEPQRQELTLAEYEKIASRAPYIKWLNLSGGEPTDRDDLVEIIEAFARNCPGLCLVNFTTNGLRPDRIEGMVSRILKLGVPRVIVNVSVDGPREVNDALRGIQGDFDQATETLSRLRKLPGLKSYLAMTLYRKNASLIDKTYRAVRERIPDFEIREMHLNYPHSSGHFYRNATIAFQAGQDLKSRLAEFEKRVGRSRNLIELLERGYRRHLIRYVETGRSPVACAATRASVYVSESGDLFPCTIWDRRIGSIQEHDYDVARLLSGEETRRVRESIARLDCPNCWSPCEAFPSLMTHGLKLL